MIEPEMARKWLAAHQIDAVLDVGAMYGQYGATVREKIGFDGDLISFEPVRDSFAELNKRADLDPKWRTVNCAVGEADRETEIGVSGNIASSSILPVAEVTVELFAPVAYTRMETVQVRRLDTLWPELGLQGRRCFLKIDAQGFEPFVIQGAAGVLDQIDLIQMELSFFPIYEGERLAHDVMGDMNQLGYRTIYVGHDWGDYDTTGEIYQADFIFARGLEPRTARSAQ